MQTVYLTRRNLRTLLAKLDRNLEVPNSSACAIIKTDTVHPKYPCSDAVEVIALEDAEYYTERAPGRMHPAEEAKLV